MSNKSDCRFYLTENVHKVVLQKSMPAQIHQLILNISRNEGSFDGFVRKLTFAKRLYEHVLRDKTDEGEKSDARWGRC